MDKQHADELIEALLCREQEALRRLPYVELIKLSGHTTRPSDSEERDSVLSTWRDLMPDSKVRVVSQHYRPGILGTARVRAKGFTMDSAGTVTELGESELWDFT